MDETVDSFLNEASPTDSAHINFGVAYVLDIHALNAEGQNHRAIRQVLNDHILFALVLLSCLHDFRLVTHVLDRKMVADCHSCCSATLNILWLLWLLSSYSRLGFLGFSNKGELLLGHRCLFLLSKSVLELSHGGLVSA